MPAERPETPSAWVDSELARSAREAARLQARLRPTTDDVRRRYAGPAADTAYPLEYLFHLLGDVRGRRILDLGCGGGQHAVLIAANGGRVTALDLSPDLLGITRDRAALDGVDDRLLIVRASTHDMPLRDGSFDLVFGNAILHHVNLERTAREVARVLKPGGRAVFKEPLRNSRLLARLRRLVPLQESDVSPYERPLRSEEVRAFAAHFSGFRDRVFRLPFVPIASLLGDGATRLAYRADRAVLRRVRPLEYFATTTVFEVRRR